MKLPSRDCNKSRKIYFKQVWNDKRKFVSYEPIDIQVDNIDFEDLGKCVKDDENGYYYGGFYHVTAGGIQTIPYHMQVDIQDGFEFYLDDDGNLVKGRAQDPNEQWAASFAFKVIHRKDINQAILDRCPYLNEIRLILNEEKLELIDLGKDYLAGVRINADIKEYRNTLRALGQDWTTVAGSRLLVMSSTRLPRCSSNMVRITR